MNKAAKNIVFLVLVVFLLTHFSLVKSFAQDKVNQYFFHSLCDSPVHYKIGTIDPRFGISQDRFLTNIKQSENIWDKVEGRELFLYDPGNRKALTINLVFDKRTQLNNQIGNMENQVSQADQNLKPQIDQYNQEKADFEKRLSDLNNQIQEWNAKGGAPQDIYDQLTKEQNNLKKEADNLNQLAKQLNLSAQSYNQDVANLNQTINFFNEALLKKPEEGLFNPNSNTINIYFDNSFNEFIHTIAHEMGHSLGLDHNSNPDSIMYPYSTKSITPTKEDAGSLKTICSQRYLSLPWIPSNSLHNQ